jgi:choline dehydrogenase-like flavoprotein
LPNDFKTQSVYQVGVDWPLDYEDLKTHYELAENELGVSGDVEALPLPGVDPKSFWGDYVFPMTQLPDSFMAKDFQSRIQGLEVQVLGESYQPSLGVTPQGRNSMPNPEYRDPFTGEKGYQPTGTPGDPLRGERCQGNSSCVPICPVQAKYSSLRTLRRAQSYTDGSVSRVTIRNQCVASKVVTDPVTNRVQHIEYIPYEIGGGQSPPQIAQGRTYVIAAHAVETAKLMLISGIGNKSDQMGRNLMDHPTLLTWGLTEQPVWPFRGPGATNAMHTFRDGPFRSQLAPFVVPVDNWGWVWSAFAPGAPFADLVASGLFGKKLRQRVAHDFSRQITLQWEFEQPPRPDNRVTIDPQYLDPLGLPRPVIEYHIDDYLLKAFAQAKAISDSLFAKANIKDCTSYSPYAPGYVEYEGKGYEFRGCGHIVGTHRMGTAADNSVTDSRMRCWDHANLYLVGCGSMPTLGTSNPSLTMGALAFRAAESILQDLNQQSPIQL